MNRIAARSLGLAGAVLVASLPPAAGAPQAARTRAETYQGLRAGAVISSRDQVAFSLVDKATYWDESPDWPALNLVLVFSRRPDPASVLDGARISRPDRVYGWGTPQSLRSMGATVVEERELAPAGASPFLAGPRPWSIRLRLPEGKLVTARNDNRNIQLHLIGVRTLAGYGSAASIPNTVVPWHFPYVELKPFKVGSPDHREAGPDVTLSWKFNKQPRLYELRVHTAPVYDSSVPGGYRWREHNTSGYQVVQRSRAGERDWSLVVRLPKPQAGIWLVDINAVADNPSQLGGQSVRHTSTLEINLDEHREDARPTGAAGFGSDTRSWMRTKIDFPAHSIDLDAGCEVYGKVIGHRFRVVRAQLLAHATIDSGIPSSGWIESTLTFGEGTFSYTWRPFPRTGLGVDLPSVQRTRNIFLLQHSFFIGPVPVIVGARADVVLYVGGRIEGVQGPGIRGSLTPGVRLDGSVFGGIGVSFLGITVGALVNVTFTLAGLELPIQVDLRVNGWDCSVNFVFYQEFLVRVEIRVHIPLPWPLPDIDINEGVTLVRHRWGPPPILLFRISSSGGSGSSSAPASSGSSSSSSGGSRSGGGSGGGSSGGGSPTRQN